MAVPEPRSSALDRLLSENALTGRSLISLHDLTGEECMGLVDAALRLKREHRGGHPWRPLRGKSLAMIFAKPSTRTRVSFEVACTQLGGHALYLTSAELQLNRGETIADTARVLSRYVDGILIRTFSHAEVEELAAEAAVPVINGLTDLLHPTQALADLLTLRERFGRLAGLRLAYVGDGNNVAHSLLFAGAKVGLHVTVASPPGYGPDPRLVELARADASETGAELRVVEDPREAAAGADALYTDVWVSMGQDEEREDRLRRFLGYQVTEGLMALARPGAIFLHCLPAHRGEEVAAEVIDGPASVVFEQAENRLHVHKAILALTMGSPSGAR